MNQRERKSKRVVDVVSFYVDNNRFPDNEEIQTLAEENDVSVHTIREDIRKAKEGKLGDKVLEILNNRLEDAGMNMEDFKNSDLIKLYQATRPKQTEAKIDLKAEIDIRGESVKSVLEEYGNLIQREHIHEERVTKG